MKVKKPFFSIITCTKNSEKYLPSCLSSIQSQDLSDYEHIIIDGKSTDKTLALIKKYLAKNPQTRLYSRSPHGISNAMNEGIKKAKGKYVYVLHSDDNLYNSQALSNVAVFLKKNTNLDWVYGQINVIDNKNKKIGVFPKYKIFQSPHPRLLKFYNYIPHQSVFMKKSLFIRERFDENLSSSMDLDLWLKISGNTEWAYMPILVANYRIHPLAQSSSKRNVKENKKNNVLVKSKYLSIPEKFLGHIVDFFLQRINKSIR